MNLEDTLKQTFESRLDAVEVAPGDAAGARTAGRRMRVRRRVAAGLAPPRWWPRGVAGTLVSTHPQRRRPNQRRTGASGSSSPTPPLSPRA